MADNTPIPCGFCGKPYALIEGASKEPVPERQGTYEHLLTCPHCHKALHLYFIDAEIEEARLQFEVAKKRGQSNTPSGIFRLQRAREMYAKIFGGVNEKLRKELGVDRTHPYTRREQPDVERESQ